MAKSTRSKGGGKPAKPYPDFPLTPHPSGRWCKKINGRLHFFGRWGRSRGGVIVPVENPAEEAQQAVDRFNDQRDDLYAGRVPRDRRTGGPILADVVNSYLTAERHLLDAGEITARTFSEYYSTCERLVSSFGRDRLVTDLAADDFGRFRAELATTRGPVALGNEINRSKMVFRFAYDQGLIEQPIRYGQSFNRPSAKVMRIARVEGGKRMFEAEELRAVLNGLSGKALAQEGNRQAPMVPNPVLGAMVLLGINCGYGQWDVASLPLHALNLDDGWATFPRPKTGVLRRAKLWPETVEALRNVLACRPSPADSANTELVFLTPKGKRWIRASTSDDPAKWSCRTDLIGREFGKVLRKLSINGRRGFYAIRHSFQTVAEESRDLPAVRHVMGHSDSSMSATYRERVSDERLQAVADVVRSWLWPQDSNGDDAG